MVSFGNYLCEEDINIKHVRCAAHVFNLVVEVALEHETTKKAIEKIRYFCKKIHSSSKLTQYLRGVTSSNSEPSLKVVLDVKTRWNSTHDMIKTALKMKKSITATSNHLVAEKESNLPVIVEADWTIAEKIDVLLEPFYQGKLF